MNMSCLKRILLLAAFSSPVLAADPPEWADGRPPLPAENNSPSSSTATPAYPWETTADRSAAAEQRSAPPVPGGNTSPIVERIQPAQPPASQPPARSMDSGRDILDLAKQIEQTVPEVDVSENPYMGRKTVGAGAGPFDEVPLNGTARHAVRQSQDWLSTVNPPAKGNGGRVMFNYGRGLPVVVCAPLRICVIELEPGERVNDQVQVGDSVRWIITPAQSGSGKNAQTLVVIKPKEAGLDTNLMIPTDRRNYYIRLVSRASEYVARVAFHYPEKAQQQWAQFVEQQRKRDASTIADLPVMSIDRLNFKYSIQGQTRFTPIRVLDNGLKTYIKLPDSVRAEELPTIILKLHDGKEQLVNARYINGWFEIDRIFDKAALILGTGPGQQKVIITNNSRAPLPPPEKSFFDYFNFGG